LQEITSYAVLGEISLDEGTKAGTDMTPNYLKEAIVHRNVVDGQENIRVHLLYFEHVVDVGSCVVLAGITLATFHEWSLLCLVLLFVEVQGPLRELIELTR
jgi:hypothetical protein